MLRIKSVFLSGIAIVVGMAACGDTDPTPEPAPKGCDAAVDVAEPATVQGDTRNGENLDEGTCIFGKGLEVRYRVVPKQTGMLDLKLTSEVDLGMYVRTTCADAASEIGCSDLVKAGEQETLSVPVTAEQPVWVVVEGYDDANAGTFSLEVASRPIACGDGKVEGTEGCDPPDEGKTCTATCETVPESCGDGIDNDVDGLTDCEDAEDCGKDAACPLSAACGGATAAMATQSGSTPNGDGLFAGSCTGGALAPEALYTFSPPSDGALTVTLSSTKNQGVYVRTACTDPVSELGCLDDAPAGMDETLVVPVQASGAVTIFVDASMPAESGAFSLDTAFTASDEVEPNQTSATASMAAGSFVGTIYPEGDVDFVKFDVPAGGATLVAEVQDLGNGDCKNFKIDSVVEIFGPDGTTSLASNDDAANFCSHAEAAMVEAGTYYIKVSAADDAMRKIFAYRLALSAQ